MVSVRLVVLVRLVCGVVVGGRWRCRGVAECWWASGWFVVVFNALGCVRCGVGFALCAVAEKIFSFTLETIGNHLLEYLCEMRLRFGPCVGSREVGFRYVPQTSEALKAEC